MLELIRGYLASTFGVILTSALVGALAQKYLPAFVALLVKGSQAVIRRLSRTAASHNFRGMYLDWLVTENRELRLAGVVTADEAKKPTLEQVFVSLYIGNQRGAASDVDMTAERRAAQVIRTWRELHEALRMHRSKPLGRHKQYEKWLRECQRRIRRRIRLPWTLDLTETEAADFGQWINENRELLDDEILGELQVRKVLRSSSRVAILGAPGSGKTTLMQHLALTYARERAGDEALRTTGVLMERLGENTWRVPILLRLSSIAQQLEVASRAQRVSTLLEIILALLPADLQAHDAAHGFFRSELERGNCIIFLDGLDEVPSQHDFEEVVKLIRGFMAAYRENHFVVTSRIVGWRGGISSDFKVFYVNDLTETQVQVFVETWYAAVEKNAVIGPLSEEGDAARRARERRAARRAGELTATLKENQGLRRLANNPMLLSIIALVHRSMATLPRERGKLYAECGRILLEQWDISRGVRVDDTHLKVEQKEAIMRRIAIAMHTGEIGAKGGTREAGTDEVLAVVRTMLPDLGKLEEEAGHLLEMLIARSGLLAERQRGVLAFTHHTFQEYFSARYLASTRENEHRAFLLDRARLWSDWWREVILLYTGSIDDASSLLREIYAQDDGDLFLRHLRLAAICLGEAVSCSDAQLRHDILHGVFLVRNGEISGDSALTPAALSYLTAWANDSGWPVSAAQRRARLWSGVADEDALSKALADGLQRSDAVERRAALSVIPGLGTSVLSRVANEAHAATLALDRDDPALVGDVLRRLAALQRMPETLARLLDLPRVAEKIIEDTIHDLGGQPPATQAEWQVLLRYAPRASPRVGATILKTMTAELAAPEAQRERLLSALEVVANDDSAAGAVAMVIGFGLGIRPTATYNIGERLIRAADANRTSRYLAANAISNHQELLSALLQLLRDPGDAEDLSGALDVIADAYDTLPPSLADEVKKYRREWLPEVRASMARLLAKLEDVDEGAVKLLFRLTRNGNIVIKMNAICALPALGRDSRSDVARILRSAARSRNAATRAAAAYAICHFGDDGLRGMLVDSYLTQRHATYRAKSERQWYDFVRLRYVLESAIELTEPNPALFAIAWDATIRFIDGAIPAERPMETALGDGGLSVIEGIHRRRRHLEHRAVRSRINRVTLLDETGDEHVSVMRHALTVLVGRKSLQGDVARVAGAITSTSAAVREFATDVLTDSSLQLCDAETVMLPIRKALDDRDHYVRLGGTKAVGGIAARMALSMAAELTSRLSDEDVTVRDAAWDVLAAHYAIQLNSRADVGSPVPLAEQVLELSRE